MSTTWEHYHHSTTSRPQNRMPSYAMACHAPNVQDAVKESGG